MPKKLRIAESVPDHVVAEFKDYHPLVAQLLYNRGIFSQQQAADFFQPEYGKLYNPFLFQDMPIAVQRVWRAVESGEKVMIHGDYDADGVTSAAVIYKTLKLLNVDVAAFIPHRENDGYGINIKNARQFVADGVKLLITVDCGVTNVAEIIYLKENGVDVVVTDHHEPPPVLPPAIAIIDPKVKSDHYPFTGISGSGVAFKLVQGLFTDSRIEKYQENFAPYGGPEGFKKWLLDIVAIGVVADVSPLLDENRILVKWGLHVLAKTKNIGLQKLLATASNRRIDSFTIGFQLAPRLNAAGRMNHANTAFRLLVTDDLSEAERLAQELNKNNSDRQKITEIAVTQAREQLAGGTQLIHFVYNKDWAPGIVGLIAGKLCEEFYRPVLAMTDSNGLIIGSGRSIEGFNITDGLRSAADWLLRFGGHSGACGFTLKESQFLDNFKTELRKMAEVSLTGRELTPYLDVEAEVDLADFTLDMVKSFSRLEPYGVENKKPVFVIKNLAVVAFDFLGDNSQHLRLMVRQNDNPIARKMVGFSMAERFRSDLRVGDVITSVCEVGINEWNGRSDLEFRLLEIIK